MPDEPEPDVVDDGPWEPPSDQTWLEVENIRGSEGADLSEWLLRGERRG